MNSLNDDVLIVAEGFSLPFFKIYGNLKIYATFCDPKNLYFVGTGLVPVRT